MFVSVDIIIFCYVVRFKIKVIVFVICRVLIINLGISVGDGECWF